MKLFPERFLTTSQNLYDPLWPSKTPKRNSHGPVTYQCTLRHCQITRLTFFCLFFLLDIAFFLSFLLLDIPFLQESVESLGLMVGARLLCFFPLIGQLSANPTKCPNLSSQLSANPSKCPILSFQLSANRSISIFSVKWHFCNFDSFTLSLVAQVARLMTGVWEYHCFHIFIFWT